LKSSEWDLTLFILASPILAVRGTMRLFRRFQLLRLAVQPAISCRTCGSAISLVGQWRCQCGFEYRGHVLRGCPVCQSFPRIIRCFRCGTTELVPV
jgi:hypothetical protein